MATNGNGMETWKDTFTVSRVFGEPIERGAVTLIPVAKVAGGGGEGSGQAEDASGPEGSGSGFGGMARPAGIYVVTEDHVEWQPAINVTLLGLAGIALAAFFALVLGNTMKYSRS